MAEPSEVPSALSFMGMTESTPFDEEETKQATPSPRKVSRKRRRMASPQEVADALPELQQRCARIVFDERRGAEGANMLNLLKVYRRWYEECVPFPAATTLDERILHVEKCGGSHSVRNTLMGLGGRAQVRKEKSALAALSGQEAAIAAARAEVVDEEEKSRSALFFGGVFESSAAPEAEAAPALDEAAMKRIEENRKAAMARRKAKEEERRREAELIAEAESMAEAEAFDDMDMAEFDLAMPSNAEEELDREMAEKAARLEALEREEALAREEAIQKELAAEQLQKEGESESSETGDEVTLSPSRSSRSQKALSPTRRSKSPVTGKRTRDDQDGQGSPKKARRSEDE